MPIPPRTPAALSISVIIPAVNEGRSIGAAIGSAHAAGADEVLVADGGSSDETPHIVRQLGATLVTSERGRARQQNAAAAQARGDLLVFLHADSQLTADCLRQIRQAQTAAPAAICGAFQQRIDATGWQYRILERGNAWRVRWLGLAYGDQGIFVRRRWFETVGGFPEAPLLEDLMLSRLARQIAPLTLLPGPVITSARRWQRHGVVRQTLRNWSIVAGYFAGLSPATLANRYRPHDRQG